ncbi:MAG: DUF3048 domain-containing protein [Patescibacteria group bacterium]
MDKDIFNPSPTQDTIKPLVISGQKKQRKGIKLLPDDPKKKKIVIISLVLGFIIGVGLIWFFFIKPGSPKQSSAPAPQAKVEAPKPTTEASKLTGVQIPIGGNARPITSIQIENSPDARPQSGLRDAGVVFEAIAEGGITRFNASFMEGQPDYIGPVRSVRPYYVDFVAPLDPVFVHAGGSADGLAQLRNVGLKDMDHGANGGAFRRVSDRYAPHNLYTSTADLDKASAGRGYTTSNAKGFARKAKETPNPTPNARAIDLALSGFLYNPHFDYDQATNSYVRSQAGKPHTDLRSGAPLSPKVVVAIATDYSTRGIYSVYRMTGTGAVYIFQDGIVTQGTWTKPDVKSQYVFTDATGKPIELNPGQTWVTMVGSVGSVKVTP